MHSKSIAGLLLSLLACPTLAVLIPQASQYAAGDSGPIEALKRAEIPEGVSRLKETLEWCEKDQEGVPLWLPDYHVDYKDTSKPGKIRVMDVREFLITGKDSGIKRSGWVQEGRLAAMAAWAQFGEVEIQQAFAGGTNNSAPWCLSGKEELFLTQPPGQDRRVGWRFENPYRKKGNDLKKEIATARSLAGNPALATWPWFINRVVYPDELPYDESWDFMGPGVDHAADFLKTLTGETPDITVAGTPLTQDASSIIAKAGDTPVIVVVPSDKSNSGIWSVMQAGSENITVWNYIEGRPMAVALPDVSDIVHLKGAAGEPDGHWDKYKDGKWKFPST